MQLNIKFKGTPSHVPQCYPLGHCASYSYSTYTLVTEDNRRQQKTTGDNRRQQNDYLSFQHCFFLEMSHHPLCPVSKYMIDVCGQAEDDTLLDTVNHIEVS